MFNGSPCSLELTPTDSDEQQDWCLRVKHLERYSNHTENIDKKGFKRVVSGYLKDRKRIMSRFQINLKNIDFKKGIFGLKIRNGQLCRSNLLGVFRSFMKALKIQI